MFQLDPIKRDVQGWAFLPAFAERRMAVGLPISMVPLQKYRDGSRRAAWIFETTSAESAHILALRSGIDYLFLGRPSRRITPRPRRDSTQRAQFFEVVFRNPAATIYRVR